MMFTTPGGKASKISANMRVDSGVTLEGLMTTVLPAAKAGATFQVMSSIG
jgi:hypothetical protein